MKKRSIILLVLILILNVKHNYAQDYGQVYVYKTSNYASDAGLSSSYLAVMGAATVNSDTPPAVTSYTASTVSPYYKFKTGELGNASIDVGIAGLENGAVTLVTSGSGPDLDGVLDGFGAINAGLSGQLIVVFPKGSDMTVPTSIQETFNGVTGGALPYLNADGYGFWLHAGVLHSITLDAPHLGYSEWYVYAMAGFSTWGDKFKFRLVDASGSAPYPLYSQIPQIAISEIMYNSSGTDDEWIEIYNATALHGSSADVDISNWIINIPLSGSGIYSGDTFTFPSSTTIAADEYLTIALGSNGDGVFNNDNPFTPDFNTLSVPDFLVAYTNDTDNLHDDSGSITLRQNDFDVIVTANYEDDTRPGTDGSGYTYESKYPHNSGSNTTSTSVWQSSFITGGSPKIKSAEVWDTSLGSSDNLTILDKENIFVANQDGNINDITINSGGFLTILRNSSSSLTVANNFTNNGTVTLNSDADEFASIIVDGTSTGNITYNRYVNTVGSDEWDLIGSPVDGLSISSFVTTNTTSSPATLATNGNAYAVGEYDNATDTWTNYTTSTVGAAGNFDIGKGYQMASVNGGTGLLSFTGTIATTAQTQAIIDNDAANAGAGRRWSLIANPFPSYVNVNDDAHASNNFITVNSDKLHDTYEAVYGYDADGTGYTVYNHTYNSNSAVYLAPGQAFMVASDDTSSDNVSFTTAMRTISGGDDFAIGDDDYDSQEVVIKLYNENTEIEETRFYFEEGLSLGLDPGYDAGAFSQSAAIMSRLVEEDGGVGLVINAMGTESMNNAIIPLVINQEAYQDFKVVLFTHTIPDNVNVYLEDNQQGTMTLLNEQDFELTPENTLSEVGRFYLHLTEGTFSIDEEVLTNNLSVFKADYNNFITIEGLVAQSGITDVKLYNILGMEVLSTSLNNNTNTQTIPTDGLASGVYVIKLQSANNQLTKKLIIK